MGSQNVHGGPGFLFGIYQPFDLPMHMLKLLVLQSP